MRRVGVVGAAGSMGALAVAAVRAADDLELAVLVAPHGAELRDGETLVADVGELDPDAVDVLVDLTRAEVARRTVVWACEHGVDLVVGTSGLADEDLAPARDTSGAHVLVVPNFSIGAVLLQRFASAAAAHFASVEVIELHHDRKRDAPSGTSLATAGALATARAANGLGPVVDPTTERTVEGARGAEGPGGIRVHSVRLPGLLAHQEVLFGAPGEGLVLRHDTYDRAAFMPGLLLSLRRVPDVDGLAIGLEHVLDG